MSAPSRRILIAVTLLVPMAIGAAAGASHRLEAEHAPPLVAFHEQEVSLEVPVTSSCFIAYCGWLQARLIYWTPDGQTHVLTDAMTYQPAVVFRFILPAGDVSAHGSYMPMSSMSYRIEVSQQDCLGDCHTGTVTLPRTGDRYDLLVVGTP